jgi:threonine/homoserine efflux transporter RhtA
MANFIHTAGTSGLLTSAPVAANASTELSGLANAGLATSATVLSQSSYNNAAQGFIELNVVSTGWAVSAGGCISGWYLLSRDGGTTYEATNSAALGRAPDFIIALPTATIAAGRYYSPLVPLPYLTHKFYLQNNTGATTSANSHIISVLPVADTYA